MSRPKKLCLFCQSADRMTKEHIFSEWLQGFVPRSFPRTRHFVATVNPWVPAPFDAVERSSIRAGDPLSGTLKVVCAACNNGWMSRVVERAKPFVRQLVQGEWPDFTEEACTRVAAWAALTSFIWEQADPATVATSVSDRELMWKTECAPPGWRVWVGLSSGMQISQHHHRGASVSLPGLPYAPRCNVQNTLVTVGRLVFQCASSSLHRSLSKLEAAPEGVFPTIWPIAGVPIPGPTAGFDRLSVYECMDVITFQLGQL